MKLLDRTILRQLAGNFLLIISALTALYLLVDVFERLKSFQERHLAGAVAARYFLMKVPIILDQIGPVALLLAGILTLGLLVNRRELQSLNAGGVSTLRVMLPFGLGALLVTALGLAAAQWLLPIAGGEVERIWQGEVKGEGWGTVRAGVTFFRGERGVYAFTVRDGDRQTLTEFRYQELARPTDSAEEAMSLYAAQATYGDGKWQLRDGQLRRGGESGEVEPFDEKILTLPEGREAFFKPLALDFEQPLSALARRALHPEQPGARQAVQDINRRLSFLLLGLPLLFLALPIILSFERGRQGINLAFAVPVSAGLAFLVWGVWSGMQALATGAVLSPLIASWSIHLGCLIGGLLLLIRWRQA